MPVRRKQGVSWPHALVRLSRVVPTGRMAVLRRQPQISQMQSPRVKRRSLRAGARRSGLVERGILGLAQRYGTASLLMAQTVVILIWIAVNAVLGVRYGHSHSGGCTYLVHGVKHVKNTPSCRGAHPFDFFPFVLLNLTFSLEAAYAAPMILYAQRVSTEASRKDALERRRARDARQADVEFLSRELADIRNQLGAALTRDFLRGQLDDRRQPKAGP